MYCVQFFEILYCIGIVLYWSNTFENCIVYCIVKENAKSPGLGQDACVGVNALREPMGRVGRSLGTAGLDTGSRGLGTGRGSTGARYRASVLGNGTKF